MVCSSQLYTMTHLWPRVILFYETLSRIKAFQSVNIVYLASRRGMEKKKIVWFIVHLFTTRGGTRRIHNFWEKFWGPVLNCFLLFKWISHSWISEQCICNLWASAVRGMDDTIPTTDDRGSQGFLPELWTSSILQRMKSKFSQGSSPETCTVPDMEVRGLHTTPGQVRSQVRGSRKHTGQVRSQVR